MRNLWYLNVLAAALFLAACTAAPGPLPILGPRALRAPGDTAYHTIPPFALKAHDGALLTLDSLRGRATVADFFFTSCPTICPRMARQLLRVQAAYAQEPRLRLLSHTIDPKRDSLPVLRAYARALGARAPQWRFLHGPTDTVYTLAERGYFATAVADSAAPGGFVHSGALVLVDGQARIRGLYDGTQPEAVDRLIADIRRLLSAPASDSGIGNQPL